MSTTLAMVEVIDLHRKFDDVEAVAGISFSVNRGEMFGLIGPDGAGKTTTMRVVLGLLAADAGRVRTCGLDPRRNASDLAQRIGYLSQRFSLYGDLTIDENIAFFAEVHGVRAWQPRRSELLDLLRLTPFRDRLADRLSGGMKQKLALACTLIHTPLLLVLDEPTTGVDPVSRRDFWKILVHLQSEGLTILLTTPYLDEAERCQRVALMDHGRLLSVDTPDALRASTGRRIVEVLARPRHTAMTALAARADVADVQSFGERLHVTLAADVSDAELTARAIERELRSVGVTVEVARAVTPSLEDVFIARLSMPQSGATRAAGVAP